MSFHGLGIISIGLKLQVISDLRWEVVCLFFFFSFFSSSHSFWGNCTDYLQEGQSVNFLNNSLIWFQSLNTPRNKRCHFQLLLTKTTQTLSSLHRRRPVGACPRSWAVSVLIRSALVRTCPLLNFDQPQKNGPLVRSLRGVWLHRSPRWTPCLRGRIQRIRAETRRLSWICTADVAVLMERTSKGTHGLQLSFTEVLPQWNGGSRVCPVPQQPQNSGTKGRKMEPFTPFFSFLI